MRGGDTILSEGMYSLGEGVDSPSEGVDTIPSESRNIHFLT